MSLQLNKQFSAPALLGQIRKDFEQIPDHRTRNQQFSLPDVLMSGLAVFGLKFPSLLKFDEHRNAERIRTNLKNLYGVSQAPCDTQLRAVLDGVAPEALHRPFIHLHQRLATHRVVDEYRYLGGVLVSLDASGQFSSTAVRCGECCEKRHRTGEVEYYHQLLAAALVHPDKRQVLPLFPEAITRQDGTTKNDCERNASKRLLPKLREAFAQRPVIILEDSLGGNGPHLKLLKELNFSFIIGVQPGDHEALFEEVQKRLCGGQVEEFEEDQEGVVRGYRWVNDLPLNRTYPELRVNYLDYWEIREGQEHNGSWITDIHLTKANVHKVMKGGRCRWKIENETFNTLKNQGYQLEHNYGHGEQHLATVFGTLMLLAFLVDQVQEVCCSLFKAARQKFRSRTSLWDKIKGLFTEYFIASWEHLWLAIIYGHQGGFLRPNTS